MHHTPENHRECKKFILVLSLIKHANSIRILVILDTSTNYVLIISAIEYVPTLMIEVSDDPLRFRSTIFPKADSPYDGKFGARKEYSEFYEKLQCS